MTKMTSLRITGLQGGLNRQKKSDNGFFVKLEKMIFLLHLTSVNHKAEKSTVSRENSRNFRAITRLETLATQATVREAKILSRKRK